VINYMALMPIMLRPNVCIEVYNVLGCAVSTATSLHCIPSSMLAIFVTSWAKGKYHETCNHLQLLRLACKSLCCLSLETERHLARLVRL
jgi:hypothetical protein